MIFEAMIIDDEAPARVELSNQLERTGRVRVVSEAVCLQEGIAKMRQTNVDVAFVDHNIVGAGTTLLADALPTIPHMPMLVYMTAYSDYRDEPFGVKPLAFLTKPVAKAELAEVVHMLEHRYHKAMAAKGIGPLAKGASNAGGAAEDAAVPAGAAGERGGRP